MYYTEVSFFLNEDSSSPKSISSPYMAILSSVASQKSKFQGMFDSLFKSRRLREYIAKALIQPGNDLSDSLAILKLKNLKLESRAGINILSFTHSDPLTSYQVIQETLNGLQFLNENLELGSSKEVIKVLDEARLPKSPMPKNYLLSFVLSLFLSFMIFSFVLILKNSFFTNE